jgi:hypothetical protein
MKSLILPVQEVRGENMQNVELAELQHHPVVMKMLDWPAETRKFVVSVEHFKRLEKL